LQLDQLELYVEKLNKEGGWGLKDIHAFGKLLVEKSIWNLITKEIIWKKIIHKKYMSPGCILYWIKSDVKIFKGGSLHWKASLHSFPIIGSMLSCKVGDGSLV
jgi:hypothetical protein